MMNILPNPFSSFRTDNLSFLFLGRSLFPGYISLGGGEYCSFSRGNKGCHIFNLGGEMMPGNLSSWDIIDLYILEPGHNTVLYSRTWI